MTGLIRLISPLLALAVTSCAPPAAPSSPPPHAVDAPEQTYPVGLRTIEIGGGTDRPLPITIWYPARPGVPAWSGAPTQPGLPTWPGAPIRPGIPAPPGPGSGPRSTPSQSGKPPPDNHDPQPDAPLAAGRFPLVIFSHGLNSLPGRYAQLTTRWAAAGFVVAAPAYPHTSQDAPWFNRGDVRRQPVDAWKVIRQLSRLDTRPKDPFAGHLDSTRVAAAGHSAGGQTTAGLFTRGHSERLRAGIVIAGGGMAGAFKGPGAALLFIHGDADRTVPAATGWAAYRRVPWPKAFLTLTGQGHGEYLVPDQPGFDQIVATTTDFLRWRLYNDPAARRRLPMDADQPGVTAFTDALG